MARFHGITAKKTSELIPMCHPLMLSHVDVTCSVESKGIRITSTAISILGPTGVEMEVLTAASVAALTVYDMTKALDKSIEIQDVYLLQRRAVSRETSSGTVRRNDQRGHCDDKRLGGSGDAKIGPVQP